MKSTPRRSAVSPGIQIFLIAIGILALCTAQGTTIHVAENGHDDASGAAEQPLRTIQHALVQAMPGDTVLVHAGVYRERVAFPRDGSSEAHITLEGQDGAVIDGGTLVSGWERVPGESGNVYRAPYSGWLPENLTWNNRYLLRIRNEVMKSEGTTILRQGPRGWDQYKGKSYRSWDGITAMWGTDEAYIYLGFGDATADPAKEEITVAPRASWGGAAVFIEGRRFITVRGFTIRNGHAAVAFRKGSSDCLIERNTLIGGLHTVDIAGGASRITVRQNTITLGYPHTLDPADPRHWFIWAAFKETSDYDRVCVNLSNVGSDNEVAENHLYEGFDGVQNEYAGTRLTVRNNHIEKIADDGLELDGEETEARWHDNVVRDANISLRYKSIIGRGPLYIFRNQFISRPQGGHGECLGIYFHSGSEALGYIYANSFSTELAMSFGSTNVKIGLPNAWVLKNVFACARLCHDNTMWTSLPQVDFNDFLASKEHAPGWWGEHNCFDPSKAAATSGLPGPEACGATESGGKLALDLTKPWTLRGQSHVALP